MGEGTFPWTLTCFIASLLFLLRYLSLAILGSSSDSVDKEVSMKKIIFSRVRIFVSSVVETTWAIGAGLVVVHLSA